MEKVHQLLDQVLMLLNHMEKYGKYPCYNVVCNSFIKSKKIFDNKFFYKCAFCKAKYGRYSTLKKHITEDHEAYNKLYDILQMIYNYVSLNIKGMDPALVDLFMKVVDNSSFDEYQIIIDAIINDSNLEPYIDKNY